MNAILPASFHASGHPERPLIRIVVVGHVDHGKSTLIGRLLHDTGSLPDGKLEMLKAVSARRGMQFEWSFILDSFQAERDQNITIDTSQVRFRTPSRDFVLIDAPGHEQFLRNMITGAAQADAAILVVDATEGLRDQTRRHGYLLSLLGVRQLIVVVNKMDRIDYDPIRFEILKAEILDYLGSLDLSPQEVIPLSAREGTGIAVAVPAPLVAPTLVDALDGLAPSRPSIDLPLRLPVQAVYRFDNRRILAGRIESGALSVGDEVTILPSRQTARIQSLENWPVAASAGGAAAGRSVGVILDRDLFIERGAVICHGASATQIAQHLTARLFWLHAKALTVGQRLQVHIGTARVSGEVLSIAQTIDPGALAPVPSGVIGPNQIGEIVLKLAAPTAVDIHASNPALGRIVIEVDGRIAGGGLVLAVESEASTERAPPALRALTSIEELHETAHRLETVLAPLTPAQRLFRLRSEVPGQISLTTSFGLEDQMLLHLIAEQELDIELVTLDTGRMFDETYDLWAESELRYNRSVRVVYPRNDTLESLVQKQGINGFTKSVEARVTCCHVRKVEPLKQALHGASAWVTGLRGDQSRQRQGAGLVEVDTDLQILKVNPLVDWTRDAVLAFTRKHRIPVNALHAKGYVSIGCAPCTRAIEPGETERAGRWWWEQSTQKECGLHSRDATPARF